jgi:pimeloyl-ACP methyl ester carboxylesterase
VSAGGEVSAYDRMVWSEQQLEQWLISGERRRELLAYFGEAEYERLRQLAIAAGRVTPDPDRCVIFVPGIMGTQLSLARERPQPDNLLWLDPSDVQQGHLAMLAIPGEALQAVGPVMYGYLPLKLALRAAGHAVRSFVYDWRLNIIDSAADLTRQLAVEPARDISLVAHSMGGLLARIALRGTAGTRVRRLVTLGTPHGGAFAPVQAVRGVYPLVRRLAQIDPVNSPELLAREVFSSFHSLYQMLPREGTPDLINTSGWPSTGPQPNATLLDRVRYLDLGPADPRITAIAGHGFLTTDNVAQVEGEFYYRYSFAGDGTVPTSRAVLAGCKAWYCNVAHGELTRSPLVHAALAQLLSDGTPDLSDAVPAPPKTAPFAASDSELRRQFSEKIDWNRLDGEQRRAFLDSLNRAPPAAL